MKTWYIRLAPYLLLFLFVLFIFNACNKNDDSSGVGNNSFQWTHKGVTRTTVYDTAYITSQGLSVLPYMIVAGDLRLNTISAKVLFHLTSFNIGNYVIGAGPGPNLIYFTDDAGNNATGVSGTLTITANVNSRMSGNFSITITDGAASTTQLTGSFTDMPVVN